MPENIAKQWLKASAETANAHDYDAHMNLISKNVSLSGVPGFDEIRYDDWAAQCKHEFENKLLKRVTYDGLKMVIDSPKQIMFRTFETVEGSDGTVNAQGIEMLIETEEDGQWRLVQERVLAPEETAYHKLKPLESKPKNIKNPNS